MYVAALFRVSRDKQLMRWLCSGEKCRGIDSNIMMYKLYHCHIWMSLYTLSEIKSVFCAFISDGSPWASLT